MKSSAFSVARSSGSPDTQPRSQYRKEGNEGTEQKGKTEGEGGGFLGGEKERKQKKYKQHHTAAKTATGQGRAAVMTGGDDPADQRG